MSLLVIFFFLYQWMVIYTVLTMACTPLEKFWLAPDQLGITPLKAFMIVFVLFGVWAITEMISAQIGGHYDKWFCTITCSLALVCVIAIMTTFRMQWEYYEVEWGIRSHKSFTFKVTNTPDEIYTDPWHEFLTRKRCEDSALLNDTSSEEGWLNLKQEFLDGGGSFERLEVGS